MSASTSDAVAHAALVKNVAHAVINVITNAIHVCIYTCAATDAALVGVQA